MLHLDVLFNSTDLNICPTTKIEETFPGLHPPCNAWGDWVYSSKGFEDAGLDVRGLANSALVEYCNNANNWEIVMGLVDSQTALANDSWSGLGSWIDADMLTVGCNDNRIPGTPCDHGTPLTVVEQYSQMSLWCLFASNLMLGSDLRNISNTTLEIIGNPEALAVNRDSLGAHGRLVHDHTGPPPTLVATPGVATPPMTCSAGALSPGAFLRVGNFTISEALKFCTSNTSCGGFTTRSSTCDATGENSTQIHEIYFKTDLAGHNTDPVWHTWKKPNYVPPPPPPRLQVFAKPMASGSRAIVLLNRGPAPVDAEVTWEMIALGAPATWSKAKVRDLWAHKDLGSFEGSFTFNGLASHGAAFLIVAEA